MVSARSVCFHVKGVNKVVLVQLVSSLELSSPSVLLQKILDATKMGFNIFPDLDVQFLLSEQ